MHMDEMSINIINVASGSQLLNFSEGCMSVHKIFFPFSIHLNFSKLQIETKINLKFQERKKKLR